MTTSNKLRAAAKTIENFFAMQPTDFNEAIITREQAAAAQDLARAYLAEHPADDNEPVTEEWLLANGVRYIAKRSEHFNCEPHGNKFGVFDFYIPFDTTRAQVRQLLAALGITQD